MSRILVTGAAGCVGSRLTQRLVRDGHDVVVLIKPGRWHPHLDGLPIRVVHGDIRDASSVLRAMEGCEHVYQVAGVVSYKLCDHQEMYTTHVTGVCNVLDAAARLGVQKVVVTASTAGIGIPEDPSHPLTEEAPFDLRRYRHVMYMYSKHLSIRACQEAAARGVPVSILSPTTIYGPGDIKMHIGGLVKKIKEGRVHVAPPGGNAVVSLDDVIDAHLLVMERGRIGENYIVANECLPYHELFSIIAGLVGAPPMTRTSPRWVRPFVSAALRLYEWMLLPFGRSPTLSADSLNFTFKFRYFDSGKARRELGWCPRMSFVSAMTEAIRFYEAQGLLSCRTGGQ